MTMREKLELLQQKRSESEQGGGADRIATQHQKGKMTARERLDVLLDPGTFVELDRFVTHRATDFGLADQKVLGDGVVTGWGRVEGRLVYVFSQDFTVTGPNVVKTVTHEEVDFEQLGGADVHGGTSGIAQFVHDSELESLTAIRSLLSFLPSNNLDSPPIRTPDDPSDRRDEALLEVVP